MSIIIMTFSTIYQQNQNTLVKINSEKESNWILVNKINHSPCFIWISVVSEIILLLLKSIYRRLCCHLSGEPFFTGSHHIGMSILGLQPEFLLIVRTPFCSQKLHKVIHWSCFWELLPHAVTEQHIISTFTLKLPAFITRKWNWCRCPCIPWIAALNWR